MFLNNLLENLNKNKATYGVLLIVLASIVSGVIIWSNTSKSLLSNLSLDKATNIKIESVTTFESINNSPVELDDVYYSNSMSKDLIKDIENKTGVTPKQANSKENLIEYLYIEDFLDFLKDRKPLDKEYTLKDNKFLIYYSLKSGVRVLEITDDLGVKNLINNPTETKDSNQVLDVKLKYDTPKDKNLTFTIRYTDYSEKELSDFSALIGTELEVNELKEVLRPR